jgi:AraC-like DNA-binding protein
MGIEFNKIPVPVQLATLVDRIVHVEYGTDPLGQSADVVVGSARINLLITLRGAMLEGDSTNNLVPLPRVAVLGPWVRGRYWQARGHTETLLIQLRGPMLERLCGVHPGELCNLSESLHELARSARLLDALEEADSSPAKVLAALAREGINGVLPQITPEQDGFDKLMLGRYGWRVKNYADPMGVCVRTLERRIHQAFGVTPKQILDTGRMSRLVRITHKGWTRRVSDLAAALDYFDQSHMRQDLARLNMDSVSDIVSGGHTIAYPDAGPGSLHTPVPEPVPLSHFS